MFTIISLLWMTEITSYTIGVVLGESKSYTYFAPLDAITSLQGVFLLIVMGYDKKKLIKFTKNLSK